MRRTVALLAAVILLTVSASAPAATVDEIAQLAQKNVGEEVLLAAVQASKDGFTLKADDIIKLKDAKVPEKVIVAMIRHNGAAAPVASAAPVAAPPAETPVIGKAATGTLTIENLDDKVWSYRFDPDASTIWIMSASADGRGNVAGHGGLNLRMPAGTYDICYAGQNKGEAVTVFAGDKSLIMLSRVDTDDVEALYATVFEKGERKGTGKLIVLRDKAGRKSAYGETYEPETGRVVVRDRFVETPSTTIVYSGYPNYGYSYPYYGYSYPSYGYSYPYYSYGYSYPYFSSSYCYPYYRSYPRYYGSSGYCSYPRNYGYSGYGHYGSYYRGGHSLGIGYSHIGRRSGVSVGAGFRF